MNYLWYAHSNEAVSLCTECASKVGSKPVRVPWRAQDTLNNADDRDDFLLNMTNRGRGRPSRRRGFDDDFAFDRAPPGDMPRIPPSWPSSAGFGPEHDATVKWFNPEKGFGFVALSDGSGDAFLHANTLNQSGHSSVSPGATLRVRIGQGQKGRQVSEVISVDESTATPGRGRGGSGAAYGDRGDRPGPRRGAPTGPSVEMQGTVKWYNATKGFGFVAPAEGGKDVFVHASALQRAGIPQLAEGQTIWMDVVQGAKGPEAASIRTS
ncbi:MAG TPA: cold-shock protein [Rhodopila sp.]|nr:cold-shock protein [Rhodopila sp.]